MRCQRSCVIDATRAPEFLDVDPGNEPSKAVANEIDPPASNVPPEVLAQSECSLLDSFTGVVVERKDLLDSAKTEVRSCGV